MKMKLFLPLFLCVMCIGIAGLTTYVHVEDGYMGYISVPVNLRFKADSTDVYPGAGKGSFLSFSVTGEEFCDWSKKDVSIDAWDIQY